MPHLLPHDSAVLPVRRDATGLSGPTPKAARGPRWRRTSHGYYVPADVDGTVPEQRIAEASVMVPEVAGITGWAGLRWCGGSWFEGTSATGPLPVVIASGSSDVRRQPGVEVCHERISNRRFVEVDGVWVTVPVRSALFQMRRAPRLSDAVVVADMAAFDDLVTIQELFAQLPEHRTITGVPLARRAAALMVENSWSPMETRLRVHLVLELGRRPPHCNMPLFDPGGRLIATPDLFDEDLGLALDYDGELHLTSSRRALDIDRESRLRDHGVETATFVRSDFHSAARLTGKLQDAVMRARRSYRARPSRWTLDQPSWWQPTHTVSLRRTLATAGLAHLLPSRRYAA